MKNDNTIGVKIGFWGLLQLAFIVLKLSKVWNVSWFIVFLPTFLPIALFLIAITIVVIVLSIKDKIKEIRNKE